MENLKQTPTTAANGNIMSAKPQKITSNQWTIFLTLMLQTKHHLPEQLLTISVLGYTEHRTYCCF
jgi:hypothetical protein